MRLRGSVEVCFVEVWYEEWELGFFDIGGGGDHVVSALVE